MNLSLGAKSSTKIISTIDMKNYLKVDTLITDDDTLIDNLVLGAMIDIEEKLGISLLTQTWNLYLDKLTQKVELPRPPLISIEKFYWYDDDYDKTEMDTTLYGTRILSKNQPGYIYKKPNQSWPSYTSNGDGIKFEYTAGFGSTPTSIPQDIIEAIKMIVAHRYENRESQVLPSGALDILQNYKVYW